MESSSLLCAVSDVIGLYYVLNILGLAEAFVDESGTGEANIMKAAMSEAAKFNAAKAETDLVEAARAEAEAARVKAKAYAARVKAIHEEWAEAEAAGDDFVYVEAASVKAARVVLSEVETSM